MGVRVGMGRNREVEGYYPWGIIPRPEGDHVKLNVKMCWTCTWLPSSSTTLLPHIQTYSTHLNIQLAVTFFGRSVSLRSFPLLRIPPQHSTPLAFVFVPWSVTPSYGVNTIVWGTGRGVRYREGGPWWDKTTERLNSWSCISLQYPHVRYTTAIPFPP